MDNVLPLILLVSEMLKIPMAKVEANFLINVQGQQKSFQDTQQYASNYVHKISYYLVYSIQLS